MQFAALALAALASAGAAPPSPPDMPIAAYPGYDHPEVTAESCKSNNPAQTICQIPAKSAGRYLIVVLAKATATGPGAAQSVAISGQGWVCGERGTKKGDWTSGPRTVIAQCIISVLNDNPLPVVATEAVQGATLDPAGPKVAIRRIPWNGVLETSNFQVGIVAPQAAAGAKPGPAK
jgi:hypothetical protein